MNANDEQCLEAANLRVRFFHRGDRYAHEIDIKSGGGWHAALASVEGSHADQWPASPPFQSLHVERGDDGRQIALLVGMAGKSHWSASVEAVDCPPAISFDVACRLRTACDGWLGSVYRLEAESDFARIEPDGPPGSVQVERNAKQVRIPAAPESEACPQTVRWRYHVRLATDTHLARGGP